jgi:hypothetical protein
MPILGILVPQLYLESHHDQKLNFGSIRLFLCRNPFAGRHAWKQICTELWNDMFRVLMQ